RTSRAAPRVARSAGIAWRDRTRRPRWTPARQSWRQDVGAILRTQPLGRLDLLHQGLVDVRHNKARERILGVVILAGAMASAVFRQQLVLDEVVEHLLAFGQVVAVGDTERVVEALPVGAVLIGVILKLARTAALTLEFPGPPKEGGTGEG